MPTGPNRILDASNNATTATFQNITYGAISDLPMGKTAGGEVGAKVVVIGGSISPPEGGTFDTTFLNTSASGSIPASTTLGWSITATSGTVTVRGVTLPVGSTVGGGGYTGYAMASAVAYDATGGTALVVYDEVV